MYSQGMSKCATGARYNRNSNQCEKRGKFFLNKIKSETQPLSKERFFSEKYHQNPLGCLLKQSRKLFGGISLIIHLSISKLFGENSMGFPLNPFKYHWTEEVQKALTIPKKHQPTPTPTHLLSIVSAKKQLNGSNICQTFGS